MKFEKPSLSIDEQIELLKCRGMTVGNDAVARHYLEFVSYYRLRAYWSIFEISPEDGDAHTFRKGTAFDDVLEVYNFDRELRLLVLDAIERVEVAFRAHWAHHMAMTHGPHGYLNLDLYQRKEWHSENVSELTEQFERSKDAFAEHYRSKYDDPKLPPVWMAAEIISFGLLSKMINGLYRTDKKAIADSFEIEEGVFVSVCRHLNYVRNICAHHGRLWNKQFTITMRINKLPNDLKINMRDADSRRLHNTLVVLNYLLSIIAPKEEWRKRIVDLIDSSDLITPAKMGFPEDWRTRSAWK